MDQKYLQKNENSSNFSLTQKFPGQSAAYITFFHKGIFTWHHIHHRSFVFSSIRPPKRKTIRIPLIFRVAS